MARPPMVFWIISTISAMLLLDLYFTQNLILTLFAAASAAACFGLSALHKALGRSFSIIFPVGGLVLVAASAGLFATGPAGTWNKFIVAIAGLLALLAGKIATAALRPEADQADRPRI